MVFKHKRLWIATDRAGDRMAIGTSPVVARRGVRANVLLCSSNPLDSQFLDVMDRARTVFEDF